MSRLLNGTDERLVGSDESSFDFERTDPFSIAMLVNHTSNDANQVLFSKYDGANRGWSIYSFDGNQDFSIILRNTVTTNDIVVSNNSPPVVGQWEVVLVTYSGSSNAAGLKYYLNGVNKALNITRDGLTATMLNAVNIEIGARNAASWLDAGVAEVAVWDRVLTPAEAVILSKRYSPLFLLNGQISHWDLIRGLNDKVGGHNLTAVGTVVAAHPRVIVPVSHASGRVSKSRIITPSTFELAATLQTPTVRVDCTVKPSTLALALTLQIPTISIAVTVAPATFELALALQTPNILIDRVVVAPSTFALALALQAPTISVDCTVIPSTLELVTSLYPPEILIRFVDIPPFIEKDLIDPYSGGAWLWLVKISVPGQPIRRIARNTENTIYGGNEFEKFNLQIGEQIFSGDGSIPRVTLRVFQDVNRIIENMINETEGALGAAIQLIRVNEKFLNTPVSALEADYDNLAAESDTEWVTFTLGMPNPLTQRYPLQIYSSKDCPLATPSLFKGPICQYTGPDGTCTGTYTDCYNKGNAIHWGAELGLNPNAVRV